MKCSNPQCNHGIGLVSYRRVFAKRRYCSKQCRDSYVIEQAGSAVPGAHRTPLASSRASEDPRRSLLGRLGGLVCDFFRPASIGSLALRDEQGILPDFIKPRLKARVG